MGAGASVADITPDMVAAEGVLHLDCRATKVPIWPYLALSKPYLAPSI